MTPSDILDLIQASKRTGIVPETALCWLETHGYPDYAGALRAQSALAEVIYEMEKA